MASPTIAANAYASLARMVDSGAGLAKSGEAGGQSFASMLKDTLGSVVEAGRKSDSQTVAMASGKANVVDVVTAISQTELAMESMVAIRDKVISAYEEIMRMPI